MFFIKSREKILRNMANLIYELVHSNKSMLWELGHYLADNLILKIGLHLAEKKGITTTYTQFPEIYNTFIEPICSKFFTYDKIKPFHRQRNFYQHDFNSIDYQIRREMAIEYYEKVSQIMLLTGIIKNEFFMPSQFLKQKIQFLRGIDISQSEWEEFINTFIKLDNLWRKTIFNKNLKFKEDDNKKKYILFYVRTISKICGNFEELGNYSIENINNSFQDIIKKMESLVFNLEALIECDGSRLREVYNQRTDSSDHYWILKSLNKINKSILNGKEKFEIDDVINPFVNLGYNINVFIRRYINYITSNH